MYRILQCDIGMLSIVLRSAACSSAVLRSTARGVNAALLSRMPCILCSVCFHRFSILGPTWYWHVSQSVHVESCRRRFWIFSDTRWFFSPKTSYTRVFLVPSACEGCSTGDTFVWAIALILSGKCMPTWWLYLSPNSITPTSRESFGVSNHRRSIYRTVAAEPPGHGGQLTPHFLKCRVLQCSLTPHF